MANHRYLISYVITKLACPLTIASCRSIQSHCGIAGTHCHLQLAYLAKRQEYPENQTELAISGGWYRNCSWGAMRGCRLKEYTGSSHTVTHPKGKTRDSHVFHSLVIAAISWKETISELLPVIVCTFPQVKAAPHPFAPRRECLKGGSR